MFCTLFRCNTVQCICFSLLAVFYHEITVRDRDGTIGKVYRLLPQAGAGVTVYRQVGSVNALTGGHSPSPNSLPG